MEETKRSKIVLIIGNGFDLDLELHTSYGEFIDSSYFSALLTGKRPELISMVPSSFWKKLEQMVPCDLAKFILNEKKKDKWVDLEMSLKHYCVEHKDDFSREKFSEEFNALVVLLYKFLALNYPYNSQYDSQSLYRRNPYWVGRHLGEMLVKTIVNSNADWNIWNFNYTDSCERILDSIDIFSPSDIKGRLHYIHGALQTSDWSGSNIVLGTDSDENVFKIFPTIIKSNRPDYYNIKRAFNKDLLIANHIILMGTSLGETDEDYFTYLLESEVLKSILIVEKDQEGADRIYQRLQYLTQDSSKGTFLQRMKNAEFEYDTFLTYDYYGLYGVEEDRKKEFESLLQKKLQ